MHAVVCVSHSKRTLILLRMKNIYAYESRANCYVCIHTMYITHIYIIMVVSLVYIASKVLFRFMHMPIFPKSIVELVECIS